MPAKRWRNASQGPQWKGSRTNGWLNTACNKGRRASAPTYCPRTMLSGSSKKRGLSLNSGERTSSAATAALIWALPSS